MTIAAGTRLGSYEITGAIGAGGMGEVYQAHDTKLGRDVAIKVLPEAFAHDPERLSRFQREAKMLASLNHPNIATIHGLEQLNGTSYLVMELVSGETLAERVKREGALPIEEALTICRQIAEALEAAHEKGIIHRDLKPANVKVTSEGKVKVLDFGLAKAFAGDVADSNPSQSPTLSAVATMQGVLLGTAAYMSPEQARGKAVDKRTDIWAFGCVLYELLTGKQAFAGDDITDILAAVVRADPDWQALPPATPVKIRDLLRRCLQKDKTMRLRDAGDARIEIHEALTSPAPNVPAVPTLPAVPAWRQVAVAGIVLLAGAAIAGVAVWNLRPASPQPVSRLAVPLPPGESLRMLNTQVLALSPDGSRIAYVSSRAGKQQIYLRAFDSMESKALSGTEGAESLFFSPDGKWLGFSAGGKLMKVSMSGGAALSICEAPNPRGVTWGDNGTIVFAPGFGVSGLSQVSAAGGKPRAITSRDPTTDEEADRWPQLLPGGRAVLFTAWNRNLDDAQIIVQRLDTRERRIILQGGTNPRYVPSGHLVYARAGTLMAVPFDLSRFQVTGEPIPVAEDVSLATEGVAQFDISRTGSLVYVPGDLQGNGRQLVWVDRKGEEQLLEAPPRNYLNPRLSPDGQRVAVTIQGANDDVWVYDIPRQTLARLTSQARSLNPIWTPDGKRIIYRSNRTGILNMFWKAADGSGEEERLTVSQSNQWPSAVSPNGQALAFVSSGRDLWILNLTGDRKSHPFQKTPFNENSPSFSPDGRWLAYTSDESGRNEVYVQPFPAGGRKVQISTEGGEQARWAHSGELFYRDGDKIMSIALTTQPTLVAGKPRMVFEGGYEPGGGYDVSPDGQRFLMIKAGEQATSATQINVVLNWFEELKQKVPTGKK
jgi:Tol biopolymer transport system component